MSAYDNYTPIEYGTPTMSREGTPVSTPTRAALLKSHFTVRGSPIKFSLSTPEKETFKNLDFDTDYDEPETKRFDVWRVICRILLWVLWGLLITSAVYLYFTMVQS